MKNRMMILWLCLCCACRQGDEGFTLQGKIDGYPGTRLFVREMIPENEAWMNDTIRVTNGEFVYKGKVTSPRLIYLIPEDFRGRYEVFLENSPIRLSASNGNFRQVEISGSETHCEYTTVKRAATPLLRRYTEYENRKAEALKTDPELYALLADSSVIWSKRLLDFLQQRENYAQSLVLPYFAGEWLRTEEIEVMESFLSGLTPEARSSVYARHCEEVLQQEKNVLPGRMAYDFVLQDTSGRTYRLSDYRGQYVLLEFSASWCGWCKLEIPYLKEVYERNRERGLQMFTISLDRERKLWVDDVAREKLPWPVLSDLQAFDGELTRQYNVRGIPIIFLIDTEGRIITNKLRGKQMVEEVTKRVMHSAEE